VLTSKVADFNEDEIEAEVIEMEKKHEKMVAEHNAMELDHEGMMKQHSLHEG
jgi:hypothetical protein